MISIILLILPLWILFGVIWIVVYDVCNPSHYTTLTIIIGGPVWWVCAFFDKLWNIINHKGKFKKIFRPRKKLI